MADKRKLEMDKRGSTWTNKSSDLFLENKNITYLRKRFSGYKVTKKSYMVRETVII